MSTYALDLPTLKTDWLCEKWSEEAVKFCQRKLERWGISRAPAELYDGSLEIARLMPVREGISSAVLRMLVGEPEEVCEIHGNLLLNEGIQRLQDMTMIATPLSNQVGTNPWSNSNAYTGIGDSNTAEAATQTELQAAANRFYKAMNPTYPQRASQTVSFQSDFTSTEANYVWAEWTISASASTPSGAGFTGGGTNLNRKVAALGTKSSGTWTLTAQVTLS